MLRRFRRKHWRDGLALCLLLIGLQQLTSAGYIQLKAGLAQLLIEQAWHTTLEANGNRTRPWPWADTWPVAQLRIPSQAQELYILAGSQGNALAFGPGYEMASAPLGATGTSVIGGHRDTHFAFLQNLQDGELLQIELASGELLQYRVVGSEIVDTGTSPRLLPKPGVDELVLVTCYPFDAVFPGGPLRYVVTAHRHFQSHRGSPPPPLQSGVYAL